MRLKNQRLSNTFASLFKVEMNPCTEYAYKFFYLRKSPRGNTKFGVMDIPWQRLRVQQQGTDEEIQFDKIWVVRTLYSRQVFVDIEEELKYIYGDFCLAKNNNRAGHTEWFSDVEISQFSSQFKELCELNGVEFLDLHYAVPYVATKKSQCPFESPKEYDRWWFNDFWKKHSIIAGF